jgi:hypothetical protein
MSKLLSLGAAAIASAVFFGAAGPAAAKDYEYCRRDVTSSSAIRRSAAPPMRPTTRRVSARRTPTRRIARDNKEARLWGQRPLA